MLNSHHIIVLGAGPAGLACCFELSQKNKGFLLIEKEKRVGGLSKTLQFGEFKTDIGPHRFFSQEKGLYDLIESLLGKHWVKVDRLTRFFIKGKFYLYPIDLKDALSKAGFLKASHFAFDYVLETIKKNFYKNPPKNLEEKFIRDFGKALAEFNMLGYNQKLWGLPSNQLSADWASQRIKDLSVWTVVKKMFSKNSQGPKTLVDQFFYPVQGNSQIYDTIRDRALSRGLGNLKLESFPVKVNHNSSEIQEIEIRTLFGVEKAQVSELVSSIPMTELVNMLSPSAPKEILFANSRLKYRSHISLFITLNKEQVFPDQWIYLPDKEIPFCRIMEPKNFTKSMSPQSKTSLLVEFFCWENDNMWQSSPNQVFEIALLWLTKLGFIKKEEVIGYFLHKEPKAYVLYDLDYQKHLKVVKDYLSQFKNLQCIGRAGSFKYNNQDQALLMGILAAQNIVAGKRIHNLNEVGSEKKYLERGNIR